MLLFVLSQHRHLSPELTSCPPVSHTPWCFQPPAPCTLVPRSPHTLTPGASNPFQTPQTHWQGTFEEYLRDMGAVATADGKPGPAELLAATEHDRAAFIVRV